MSVGVLGGSEEPPARFGPERGVFEFFLTERPEFNANRPPVCLEDITRAKPLSWAVIHLANTAPNN